MVNLRCCITVCGQSAKTAIGQGIFDELWRNRTFDVAYVFTHHTKKQFSDIEYMFMNSPEEDNDHEKSMLLQLFAYLPRCFRMLSIKKGQENITKIKK